MAHAFIRSSREAKAGRSVNSKTANAREILYITTRREEPRSLRVYPNAFDNTNLLGLTNVLQREVLLSPLTTRELRCKSKQKSFCNWSRRCQKVLGSNFKTSPTPDAGARSEARAAEATAARDPATSERRAEPAPELTSAAHARTPSTHPQPPRQSPETEGQGQD